MKELLKIFIHTFITMVVMVTFVLIISMICFGLIGGTIGLLLGICIFASILITILAYYYPED